MPSIFWAIIILLLYSLHTDDIPNYDLWTLFSADKLAHVFIFAIFTHLLLTGLNKQTVSTKWKHNALKLTVSISFLYGTVLELIQGTVFASRSTELLDFFANWMGVVVGLLTFKLVYGWLKRDVA